MFTLFPTLKAAVRPCPRCGKPTLHEKTGTQHALQFMVTFFTFFLWTPVWIAFALLEAARRWRCKECAALVAPGPTDRKAA